MSKVNKKKTRIKGVTMKFFKAPKEILAGIMIVTVLGTLAPFGSFADNQKSPVVINGEEGAPVYKGFIEIVNNVAIPDTVTFKGLKDKDTVFVYKDNNDAAGDLLAKGTAKKTKEGYEALVSIKQQIQGDSVWVSLAEYGKKETEKIKIKVGAEELTQTDYIYEVKKDEDGNDIVTNKINEYFLVHNNVGIADEVEVKNPFVANKDKPEDEMKPIPEKTLISVYDAEKDGKELGKGTVKKDGTLLIKLKDQLKEEEPKDGFVGQVYIGLTEYNKREGESRIMVSIPKAGKTQDLTANQINVSVNISIASTVEVKGLKDKDLISVYRSKEVLGEDGEPVKDEKQEPVLEAGELMGTAKVKKVANDYVASLLVKESIEHGQVIHISNRSYGSEESEKLKYTIIDEIDHQTKLPFVEGNEETVFGDYIIIHNNHNLADEIEIKTPNKKDYPIIPAKTIVTVYADENKNTELGKGTLKAGGNIVIKLKDPLRDLKIEKDSEGNDSIVGSPAIYLSLTAANKLESEVYEYKFRPEDIEKTSKDLNTSQIKVTNNIGIPSTITIGGLKAKDLIKVYGQFDQDDEGKKQLSAPIISGSAKGDSLSLSVKDQLPNPIWLTRTEYGKIESLNATEVTVADLVKSAEIGKNQITIKYNIGIPHEIKVSGLEDKDIIKIYASKDDTKPILQGTSKKEEALITSTLDLGENLYISRTSVSQGKAESERLEVAVSKEGLDSKSPVAENSVDVLIHNNSNSADIIEVRGLNEKDLIKVYKHNEQNNTHESLPIASGQAKKDGVVFISLKDQLEGEKIWLSLTEYGKYESQRIAKTFEDEMTSAKLDASNHILIENNSSIADKVSLQNLKDKDLIIIYDDNYKELARGLAKKDGNLALVLKEQLAKFDPKANDKPKIILKRQEVNKAISEPYALDIPAEKTASSLSDGDIKVLNNKGSADIVEIVGPIENATYRVYENRKVTINGENQDIAGNEIGAAIAKKTDKLSISLKKQIDGELIHVSVSGYGEPESALIKKLVPSEQITEEIFERDISLERYVGISSLVEVRNQNPKDLITIYKGEKKDGTRGGQKIASGAADKDGLARVSIKDINALDDLETIYVSAKTDNKKESAYTEIKVYGEPKAGSLNPYFVQVYNNVGKADGLVVQNIFAQDKVTVYKAEAGQDENEDPIDVPGRVIGTGTAKIYGDLEVILKEELDQAGKKIFVSLTSYGKPESEKIAISIPEEKSSNTIRQSTVTILNYAGLSDIVKVEGLKDKDQISVYQKDKESYYLIGKGTAKKDGTVSISLKDQLPDVIEGIGEDSDEWPVIGISLTEDNKKEGEKIDLKIPKEATTNKWLNAAGDENHTAFIKVNNNVSQADNLIIRGVSGGTTIRVYEDKENVPGDLLTSAVQKKYGSLTINLKNQLKESQEKSQEIAGYIWISRAEYGKRESERVKMPFGWESVTDQQRLENIEVTISNNHGIPDTMAVTGLYNKDLIRVYNSDKEDRLELARGIAKADGSLMLIFKDQLPDQGADPKIYLSITEENRLESELKELDVPETKASTFPWEGPEIGGSKTEGNGSEDEGLGAGQGGSATYNLDFVSSGGLLNQPQASENKLVDKPASKIPASNPVNNNPALSPVPPVQGGSTGSRTNQDDNSQSSGAPYPYSQPSIGKSQKLDDSMVQIDSSGNIIVEGLVAGDLVKAYKESGGILNTGTASGSGKASFRVSTTEKYVWPTVTEKGRLESIKIKVKVG